MTSSSYDPNYFSLADIIVTQERVACTIQSRLPGMGRLDPSSIDADLEPGKKVEFPLWYAMHFDASRQRHLKAHIPDIYKKISKEVCEADATAVELGRMNKNFYEFGRYVTRFDRVGYIGPMLVDVSEALLTDLVFKCACGLFEYMAIVRAGLPPALTHADGPVQGQHQRPQERHEARPPGEGALRGRLSHEPEVLALAAGGQCDH